MLDAIIQNFKKIDIKAMRPDDFYTTFFAAKKNDVERIGKGSGWEDWLVCPICGNGQSEVEFDSQGIKIRKCTDCTHRYTDKVPNNIAEVYDSVDYQKAVENLEIKHKDYRMNRFGKERAQLVMDLFEDTTRNVLDVGSGWGYFLMLLKEAGFDCYGIELSQALAEFSRKEFDLDVVSTPIEEYQTNIRFDIITLFGVIEHVKAPVNIMKKCKRLLKDNGYILLFTPNFESVAVNLKKQNANMVYPGQHLHHFTKRSMEKVCELIQMKLFSFCTKGLDVGDILSYYRYKEKEEVASFLSDKSSLLQSIIDEAGCGNHMRVILKE